MSRQRIAQSTILAAAILFQPVSAGAHSKAFCKLEAFNICLEAHFPHSWCVAVAEQQCGSHSHGGSGVNPAGSDYQSTPGPGTELNKKRLKLRLKR
jgi:hypothetical protein